MPVVLQHGYHNREIAERLGSSLRSVERKLARIRAEWSHATSDDA
ncbi:MAG: hypothetical protein HQ582_15400 [Planctomycetes bacterium]|nr:hypothetical protein [Planctomycetota bacterium]